MKYTLDVNLPVSKHSLMILGSIPIDGVLEETRKLS